nr:probable L-cysteine desulfhydrase, chloroplastic [Ipomoea batatas]
MATFSFAQSNHLNGPEKQSTFISDEDLRSEFSHHDPAVARINNGSFGSCPASILAEQERWRLRFLEQPDNFCLNVLKPSILESRSLIKTLVNADDVSEISIVDNATTAVAIVLQHVTWSFFSSRFSRGDAAVILHYAYGAVKKSVEAYVARAGGKVIEVPLPFPVKSNDEIISLFSESLEKGKMNGGKIRLAVIDHITSMPSVVIPVKQLVQMCRDEGVDMILVDGAHAIGNFCPPSVAFLYCKNSDRLSDLHHPVVSLEYGNGLPIESTWIGTRDYSAQLVVPQVMALLSKVEGGIEGIRRRNHEKVVEMAEMLAKAWGTNLGAPREMCSSMAMVGMPACLGISSDSDALRLRSHLRDCFRVEVPIYYRPPLEGDGDVNPITGYARISHQVYNKVEDYYHFRDVVNKLVNDGFSCSLLPN